MNMEFTRHEPCYDQILLVLALDKQKMKERILIGEELQIQFRLQGHKGTDLLCDTTRPLGTFLSEFEHDSNDNWNLNVLSSLREALSSNRWEQPALEQTAAAFLRAKYDTHDPLCQYLAFRVWNSYLLAREPRDRAAARERFMAKASALTAAITGTPPLEFDDSGKPKLLNLSHRIYGSVPTEDTRLELWYPDKKRNVECVVAYQSLYPLIIYYLKHLHDWGLCFRKCKVCGRIFLAKSQRYVLCSEKCRQKQALQNKRDFDKRAKANNYDLLYKNECQNWRNKINKAKRTAGFPAARLEEMQAAFAVFKKEALLRKKAVKQKIASPKEFTDWLYQQSNIVIEFSRFS